MNKELRIKYLTFRRNMLYSRDFVANAKIINKIDREIRRLKQSDD